VIFEQILKVEEGAMRASQPMNFRNMPKSAGQR